ncbi:MAG: DUF2029 domain-containing protein [Candidatus Zixiibacteriota bacterium]|nr:MAG: DUF2029 domain-containing protein [candidate division Zixibacteria bacterium]
MTRRGSKHEAGSLADDRAASRARITPFAFGAAGITLLGLIYYALTWRSFKAIIGFCPHEFCDFIEYYYPMAEAVLRTGLPVDGFLYSPFVAILLAVFPSLGMNVSLVIWGILQVAFVILYLFLFRRLVPAGLPIQLLFVILALSSYPIALNSLGGQVSVFMLVAILGMLVVKERGHTAVAAGLLAFAVSFKFYPIVFLAPFVANRDMRFLLYATVACVTFLLVIPGVFLGFSGTLGFYGGLFDAFRDSGWVAANPHSNFLPHVVVRLADAMGYDAQDHRSILYVIAYSIAAANMGLLFLVQRARLSYADLWSFQIVFLTIPFVFKTSWPHDLVFLSFTQALLAWRLLGDRTQASSWRERITPTRMIMALTLLLPSIVFSNIVFFNLLGDFTGYGYYAFLFWANLLCLIAIYVELLPPALRRMRGCKAEEMEGG